VILVPGFSNQSEEQSAAVWFFRSPTCSRKSNDCGYKSNKFEESPRKKVPIGTLNFSNLPISAMLGTGSWSCIEVRMLEIAPYIHGK